MSISAASKDVESYSTMEADENLTDHEETVTTEEVNIGHFHRHHKKHIKGADGYLMRQLRCCPLRGRDTQLYLFLWLLCAINVVGSAWGWQIAALSAGYSIVVSCLISFFSVRRSMAWCFYSVACFVFTGFGIFCGIYFHRAFVSRQKLDCGIVLFLAILLLVMVVLSRLVPLCFHSIVGSSAKWAKAHGWGWQPEVLGDMKFGWECSNPVDVHMISHTWNFHAGKYSGRLVQDILHHRAYWCGEVAADYIFMLCNDHDWLHVFFCFPGHGINRIQAAMLVVMLGAIGVFAAAAFSAIIRVDLLRLVVIFIVATVPRFFLRNYLMKAALQDNELDLTSSHRFKRWGAGKWRFIVRKKLYKSNRIIHQWQLVAEKARRRELEWECTKVYIGFFLASAIFIGLCIAVITGMGYPLGNTILENCDVLAFMFVIRLWMQILIFHGVDRGRRRPGGFYLGFFHHWYSQHMQYGSLLPLGYTAKRHHVRHASSSSLLHKAFSELCGHGARDSVPSPKKHHNHQHSAKHSSDSSHQIEQAVSSV